MNILKVARLFRLRFAILLLVPALAGFPSTAASQQPADVFEVLVSAKLLGIPVGQPAGGTLGGTLQTLTALANGTPCIRANIAGSDDIVMQLGLAGQPIQCSLDGAVVSFIDGQNHELSMTMTLQKGTRATLSNVAPVPPGSSRSTTPGSTGDRSEIVRPPHTGDAGLILKTP